MSLDYVKNKLISQPIIMSKNISRNSDFLEKLGRRAKGNATPKVGKILELYNLRKIAQVQTAENVILKLISKDAKEQQKGFKLADKIIAKHHEVEPLSHRLRQKTTVRVETKSLRILALVMIRSLKQILELIYICMKDKMENMRYLISFIAQLKIKCITKLRKC